MYNDRWRGNGKHTSPFRDIYSCFRPRDDQSISVDMEGTRFRFAYFFFLEPIDSTVYFSDSFWRFWRPFS